MTRAEIENLLALAEKATGLRKPLYSGKFRAACSPAAIADLCRSLIAAEDYAKNMIPRLNASVDAVSNPIAWAAKQELRADAAERSEAISYEFAKAAEAGSRQLQDERDVARDKLMEAEAREAALRKALGKIAASSLGAYPEQAEIVNIARAALASTGSEAADVIRAAEKWRVSRSDDITRDAWEADAPAGALLDAVDAYRAAHKERT